MRKILLIVIAFTPTNCLRVALYRLFFSYQIDKRSRIGPFCFIDCKSLVMKGAKIGYLNYIKIETLTMSEGSLIYNRNRVKNLHEVTMGKESTITKGNFIGGQRKGLKFEGFDFSLQNLIVGDRTNILRNNYFDVVRPIEIGKNVVFGGEGSEIWTHGFETNRKMLVGKVTFGDDIFIGSGCIFTKSIHIVSNVTIGPGSVIYKSIEEQGFYTTHQIVKVK